jgi:hypothetical protein
MDRLPPAGSAARERAMERALFGEKPTLDIVKTSPESPPLARRLRKAS